MKVKEYIAHSDLGIGKDVRDSENSLPTVRYVPAMSAFIATSVRSLTHTIPSPE